MKSKIKIMYNKPEVTDEEIRSHMNFERLLRDAKSYAGRKGHSTPFKIISVLSGVIITASVIYFQGRAPIVTETERDIPSGTQEQAAPPAPKEGSVLTVEKEKKEEAVSTLPKRKTQQDQISSTQPKNKPDSVFTTPTPLYVEAEPTVGFQALYEYFNTELKYPRPAVKDSIQGIVTVNFVISSKGIPEKIKILNSLGPDFDAEAIRLIEHMPAWKPATLNDKPVPSKISLPLTFRIERIKK